MLALVELVTDGVLGSLSASSERCVSVALGDLLVALLFDGGKGMRDKSAAII